MKADRLRRPVRRTRSNGAGTRVLVVIENVPLARDHRARKQLAALASAGYEVSVICRRDPANHGHPGLETVRVYEYQGPSESASKIGHLWEYGVSLVAAFVLCVRVRVERGFDFMQIGNPPDAQFLLALPFRWFGCRLVVDQRDLSPEVYVERYDKDHGLLWWMILVLERRSWRSSDHIITVNKSLVDTIVDRGEVPREKVTIVGNGPYRDRAGEAHAELKCGKRFMVLWLGLMGPQDHCDLALQAARYMRVAFARADCLFVFIGDGEELPRLRELSLELGIDDMVTFTGWLDEKKCVEYLATADVALDTNLQPEVTPVKGLEYMSFGVPMVSFDLRETRVMAGDAAAYVATGEAHALAEKIVELLDDAGRREKMGATGRRRIEETFAWEHQASRYLNAFATLREGLRETRYADERSRGNSADDRQSRVVRSGRAGQGERND